MDECPSSLRAENEHQNLLSASAPCLTWLVLVANVAVLLVTAIVVSTSSLGTQNPVRSTSVALRSRLADDAIEQDFVFAISHFNSSRQYGKCLNLVMTYRYSPGSTNSSTFLDYRTLRTLALGYLQPSAGFPMEVQWEVINRALVHDIMQRQTKNLVALASVIQVLSQPNRGKVREPSNHGSVVSVGRMPTPSVDWVNAFKYDCTLVNHSSVV